ncbi:hypothetical protein J6590_005384 [Homalodisca vitripennis]|nr:hypothetical protein J6590_005384 [Homalodisca vitripennis]
MTSNTQVDDNINTLVRDITTRSVLFTAKVEVVDSLRSGDLEVNTLIGRNISQLANSRPLFHDLQISGCSCNGKRNLIEIGITFQINVPVSEAYQTGQTRFQLNPNTKQTIPDLRDLTGMTDCRLYPRYLALGMYPWYVLGRDTFVNSLPTKATKYMGMTTHCKDPMAYSLAILRIFIFGNANIVGLILCLILVPRNDCGDARTCRKNVLWFANSAHEQARNYPSTVGGVIHPVSTLRCFQP